LLLSAALVVGAKASGWSSPFLPNAWSTVATLGVSFAFSARAVGDFRWVGFFKRERGSRFACLDDRIYAPLCVAIGIGALLVALGGK
jgi:hypothetical protein